METLDNQGVLMMEELIVSLWGTLQGCLGVGGEEVNHIPRGLRLDTPGALHYVMTRGLERQQIIRDHIV